MSSAVTAKVPRATSFPSRLGSSFSIFFASALAAEQTALPSTFSLLLCPCSFFTTALAAERPWLQPHHCQAECNEGQAGCFSHLHSVRYDLLHEDDHRQDAHPHQVHGADDEQHRHQAPATAQTVGAVVQAHAKGAQGTVPPTGEQESHRRATL